MQHNPVLNQNSIPPILPQPHQPAPAPASAPGLGPLPENPPFNLAVTEEEKKLLDEVREKLMDIKLEVCSLCHEEWFDLKVVNGICSKCNHTAKKPTKYHQTLCKVLG
jgi:hypothetical protein